jgi:hypothetical protein
MAKIGQIEESFRRLKDSPEDLPLFLIYIYDIFKSERVL